MSILMGILNSRDHELTTPMISAIFATHASHLREELGVPPDAEIEYFFESGNSATKDRCRSKMFSRHRFTAAKADIIKVQEAINNPEQHLYAKWCDFDADRDLILRAAELARNNAEVLVKVTDTDFLINCSSALKAAPPITFFDDHGYYQIASFAAVQVLDAAYNVSFGDGVVNGPYRLFKTCKEMFTFLDKPDAPTTVI